MINITLALLKKLTFQLQEICHALDKRVFFISVLSVFVFAILAHLYCYSNTMYSHDSTATIIQTNDASWKITLGRFSQLLNLKFRGYVQAPWLIGVLTIAWLSLSNYFIVKICDMRERLPIVLCAGIVVTNLAFTVTNAAFFHEADAFALGLLFSTLCVYFVHTSRYWYLLSPLFLCVSLGFYQAYVAVTCFLCLMLILKEVGCNASARDLLHLMGKMFISFLAGGALYALCAHVVQSYYGLQAAETYNSVNLVVTKFRDGNYISDIPFYFSAAYREFLAFFTIPKTYHVGVMRYLNVALLLLMICHMAAIVRWQRVRLLPLILGIIACFLMPLAVNIIFFIAQFLPHDGARCAHALVYVLFIYFALTFRQLAARRSENAQLISRWTFGATVFSCALFIFSNIIYSNQIYLQRDFAYQATSSFITRVISDIEKLPQYRLGVTPIVFIGNFEDNDAFLARSGFEHLRRLKTVDFPLAISSVKLRSFYRSYFHQILSYPVNIALPHPYREEGQKAIIDQMPPFPELGYCQMHDGVIYIKLSDLKSHKRF